MARWRVTPGFKDNSLKADIKYDEHGSTMKVEQDERPFVDMIKQERETHNTKHSHVRKFATIPDIVAIEILENWGLDIHSPTFMHDVDALKKLKMILIKDYPHLVVGT